MTDDPGHDVQAGDDDLEPPLSVKKAGTPTPLWRQYEEDVAELLASTDPDAVVQHDQQVTGRSGHNRQVDVLITGKMGGSEFKIAVECKRYKTKLQITTVDQFAGKLIDLCVDRGVIYTFSEPSRGAWNRARVADHPKIEIRPVKDPQALKPWPAVVPEFMGFGDCPNVNCYTGDITWATWKTNAGPVEAGSCNVCGTWAARCPTCDEVVDFHTNESECFNCNNRLHLIEDRKGSDVEEIEVELGDPSANETRDV